MMKKTGTQMTRKEKNREAKQQKAVAVAVEDDEAYFGRILKINQNRCVIHIWDHENSRHLEVQGVLPNKKKAVIRINDIVNVARSHPDWEVQVSIDRKTATRLRKNNRITDTILNEGSGGSGAAAEEAFEFDYETAPATTSAEAPEQVRGGAGGGKKAVVLDEEDLDIDDI